MHVIALAEPCLQLLCLHMVKFEMRFVFNIDFKKTQSYNQIPLNFLLKIRCPQKGYYDVYNPWLR